MSVIYKNGKYYGQEGGGSASFPPGGDAGQALIKNSSEDDDVKWGNPEEGRAKSSAIAPVFDEETTYAEGDRVTYEDELYVFNKAHTGAWDSADADKSDVDSEIPDAMTASDLQDVKDAFSGMNKGAPLRMMNYSTDEQVVGTWIDGKPLYQKAFQIDITVPSSGSVILIIGSISSDFENVIECTGMIHQGTANNVALFRPAPVSEVWITDGTASSQVRGSIYFRSVSATDLKGTSTIFCAVKYTKTTD